MGEWALFERVQHRRIFTCEGRSVWHCEDLGSGWSGLLTPVVGCFSPAAAEGCLALAPQDPLSGGATECHPP